MIKTDKKLKEEVYEKWEDKLEKDEWYFSNSFESIIKEMTSEEAFHYIPNVLEVLFKLDDDYLVLVTLYFLIELYSIANTTQIHPFLESNWSVLTNHIKKFNDAYATPFKELENHPRIRK